jgi:hypothetical protein
MNYHVLPYSRGLKGIFAGNQSALDWADEVGGRSPPSDPVTFREFCLTFVAKRQNKEKGKNMAKPEKEKTKIEAFRLLKNGMRCQKVAEKLSLSPRTIQRWAKEIEPIPIKISDDETSDKTSDETPQENPNPSHDTEIILSRSVAVRLVRLADAAIGAVEEILASPDASTANRLKAAKIAGDWLGLGISQPYAEKSLLRRAGDAFECEFLPPRPEPLPIERTRTQYGKEDNSAKVNQADNNYL